MYLSFKGLLYYTLEPWYLSNIILRAILIPDKLFEEGKRMNKDENLVRKLLALNDEQSREFSRLTPERKRWTDIHPTKIIVFECMDGRVNFPLSVGLPFGIVSSFRSMGGIFDLGIPYFAKTLSTVVRKSLVEGRDSLLIVTYHFSKGDKHNGCKGHNYDTDSAKLGAEKFCAELKEIFAKKKAYPIVLGIETEEDRFIVESSFLEKLPKTVRKDLDYLLSENAKRANKLIRTEKEKQHGENIVAVGTGFDWFHSYNQSLIIGPWHYDLNAPIVTAANIVLSNLKEKRISESDGLFLLCGVVPSGSSAIELSFAKKEAKVLSEHCLKMLEISVQEIIPHLHVLAGITDPKTRKFLPVL